MTQQKLTVRQKQRIGAKMAKFSRKIDEKLDNMKGDFRELLLEMVESSYKEGFHDGVETEKNEMERAKVREKGAYC